jgi:uncharacterized protein DUF3800
MNFAKPTRIVRLVYFDEAGTGSITDEPLTVVAAVFVHGDDQWGPIEQRTDRIIAELVPEKDRENFEFHAKELFSGSKKCDWGKEKRWEVFKAFLETFQEIRIPIVWAGAVRRNVMELYRENSLLMKFGDARLPHITAFWLAQSQVEIWFRNYASGEKGICIADPVEKKQMREILASIQHHTRRKGIDVGNPELGPTFRHEHIIEAVSFIDSHKSIGVQLSDACNFLIKRHEGKKADSEHFYKIIEPWIQNRSRLVIGE